MDAGSQLVMHHLARRVGSVPAMTQSFLTVMLACMLSAAAGCGSTRRGPTDPAIAESSRIASTNLTRYSDLEAVFGLGVLSVPQSGSAVEQATMVFPGKPGEVVYAIADSLLSIQSAILTTRQSWTARYDSGMMDVIMYNEACVTADRMYARVLEFISNSYRDGTPLYVVRGDIEIRQVSMDDWRRDALAAASEGTKSKKFAQVAALYERLAEVEPDREQALWKAAVAHVAAGNKQGAESNLARFRLAATPQQLADADPVIRELEVQIAAIGGLKNGA